jgi:NAD+ kinase
VTAVVLVPHHERPEAAALARTASAWLAERGHEAWMPEADARAVDLLELASARPVSEADLAMALGGDGTVLRTVDLIDGAPVPVLGVNVGVLGYLAEVEPPAITVALERFLAGDHEVEERMLLAVMVSLASGRPAPPVRRALNEAVLEKNESTHTVRLVVSIDDEAFTSYVADGLIIATPTGSTAYSLSVRGPIVSPRHRAIILTPVSPHMLFDRSLVLDPAEVVGIEVAGHRPAALSVDGQLMAVLEEGDRVTLRAAAETARFVRFAGRHFHGILKAKFGLSAR